MHYDFLFYITNHCNHKNNGNLNKDLSLLYTIFDDDLKMKKTPLVSMVHTIVFQRFTGKLTIGITTIASQ